MAHPDLDSVLNAVLPFAQQSLAKRGLFHPFSATLNTGGEIALAMSGENAQDSIADVERLRSLIRNNSSSGEIRAAAICFDGRVIPPGSASKVDAICVELEHVSAEPIAVFLPYTKGWFGRVKYGTLFASAIDPTLLGPARNQTS